jgi:UDP-N-acetylglucosamine diphosphorylase / glucose-1-phosphate thymidylyltransferase / UDP-N-acetylgalactosamine diphosphorylase / glucosamine-1-phosphate N-acetyltransferase / galactosamine-1-phosphate N-acetyltransferase
MQAVILAAGKSTRTYPLTLTKPKPLLKIANKTILEYNIEALGKLVNEIIIVVGYKKEHIKKLIFEKFPNLKITFSEQKEQLGTGNAVYVVEKYIKGSFVLLMGDNVYSKRDFNKVASNINSILVTKTENPGLYGVIKEKNGILVGIVEKPKVFISDIISCGMFSFDEKIFQSIKKIKKSERGEIELPDAINDISKHEEVRCIKTKSCLQITFPWDLLAADKKIRNGKNSIGKGSKVYGNVKNSSIGKNCIINGDVKNSIIMDNTIIAGKSAVADSIIGENVYLRGKIRSKASAYSIVKNKKIKVKGLGAIVGDNVKARDVVINPGCKIWPNKKITGRITHDEV